MSVIYEPKGRAAEYAHLALNIFTGCSHGCTYCYARDMHKKFGGKGDFDSPSVKENLLNRLQPDLAKYADTDKRVLLCFTCDPYQPVEAETQITRDIINELRHWSIPFEILTKAGLAAVRDFDLYGPNDAFSTTLTFLDAEKSLIFEPRAALPADRIIAIWQACEAGITTQVSLEPVIDPAETLKLIETTYGCVDLFKIGKLNHIASSTDWRAFGKKALEMCRDFKVDYYIKKDLAAYLDGVPFCNVDTRTVKR